MIVEDPPGDVQQIANQRIAHRVAHAHPGLASGRFTNGIAILIASTQIRDVFGLQTPAPPGEFLARMRMLLSFAGTASGPAMMLAATTIAIVLGCRWVSRRIPGSIVAYCLYRRRGRG